MDFTIYLLPYTYGKTFNRDDFITLFPDSMIATALTDPEATEIDIPNRVVTPYVLNYLVNVVNGGIPEVSYIFPSGLLEGEGSLNMIDASRYLLIPLLNVISDSNYSLLMKQYPDLNIADPVQLYQLYLNILRFGLLHGYTSLISYLFDHVDISKRLQDNFEALFVSAYMNNVSVTLKLLQYTIDPAQRIDKDHFRGLVNYDPTKGGGHFIEQRLDGVDIADASALGNANDILALLVSNPQFKDIEWNIVLDICAYDNNLGGIDLIRKLISPDDIIGLIYDKALVDNW